MYIITLITMYDTSLVKLSIKQKHLKDNHKT